jgi:hypothetical protein
MQARGTTRDWRPPVIFFEIVTIPRDDDGLDARVGLASNDAMTSDAIASLMGEIEKAVNEPTMADRLRQSLPELQQRFAVAREREELAHWHEEYARVDALSDQGAERFAKVEMLIAEICDIYLETEAITAECSKFNRHAPPGMHVVETELKARGLTAFSRINPPLAKQTQLPDYDHSELNVWPQRKTAYVPAFTPAPADARYSADWGKLADERRRVDEERIERQLDDAEAAKREFYRPRD